MIRVRFYVEKVDEETKTNVVADDIMIDESAINVGRVYREHVKKEVWHIRDAPHGDPGQKETWCTTEITGYVLTVYGGSLPQCKAALLEAPVGLEEVIRALNPKPGEFREQYMEDLDPARLYRTGNPGGTNPMTMSDIVTVELTRG